MGEMHENASHKKNLNYYEGDVYEKIIIAVASYTYGHRISSMYSK